MNRVTLAIAALDPLHPDHKAVRPASATESMSRAISDLNGVDVHKSGPTAIDHWVGAVVAYGGSSSTTFHGERVYFK